MRLKDKVAIITGAAHGMVTMAQALQRLSSVDLATAPSTPSPL